MRVAVFDSRRGQREGEEADKILFFFPATTPLAEQVSLVGLWEGLRAFTKLFSPAHAADAVHARLQSHVLLECEPHIVLALVVDAPAASAPPSSSSSSAPPPSCSPSVRAGALRSLLSAAHSLLLLFCGPLERLLAGHSSPALARRCLAAVLTDAFAGGLPSPSSLSLPAFSRAPTPPVPLPLPSLLDSLSSPFLARSPPPLPYPLALSTQALLRRLSSCCSPLPLHALLLFHDALLASSLPPDETAALVLYARCRLLPSVVPPTPPDPSSSAPPPSLAPAASAALLSSWPACLDPPPRPLRPAAWCSQPAPRQPPFAAPSLPSPGWLSTEEWRGASALLPSSCQWEAQGTPPDTGGASPQPSLSCGLVHLPSLATGAEPPSSTPSSSGSSSFASSSSAPPPLACLHVLHEASITVLLLRPLVSCALPPLPRPSPSSSPPPACSCLGCMQPWQRPPLPAALRQHLAALSAQLSAQSRGPLAVHIPGCRYFASRAALLSYEASPPAKVATLCRDSLLALNQLQEEAEERRSRAVLAAAGGAEGEGRGQQVQQGVGQSTGAAGACGSTVDCGQGGEAGAAAAARDSNGSSGVGGAAASTAADVAPPHATDALLSRAAQAAWGAAQAREEEVLSRIGRRAWSVEWCGKGGQLHAVMEKATESLAGADAKARGLLGG